MKKILALTLVLVMIAGCGATSLKLGLGTVTTVKGSAAAADKAGSTQADVTVVAGTFDANGKIVNVYVDCVQAKASIAVDGTVTPATDVKSKKELKDDYGMRKASAIGKEIHEQYEALEKYMIGKKVSDVLAMPTYDKGDGSHTAVPDVAELKSSCTITIGDYLKALEKAYANAK